MLQPPQPLKLPPQLLEARQLPRERRRRKTRKTNLLRLPPLLLQVGEDEVLLNDSLRLADAARAAGMDVRLERYAELWHVFQAHAGLLQASNDALQRVVDFIDGAQADSVS